MTELVARKLTKEAFAPFGEVIETDGSQNFRINDGRCVRHHALATAEVAGPGACVIVSIFSGEPYPLPHVVTMVERHPLGSQAFYPLGTDPWLVVVCEDEDARPVRPRAFLASARQGINIARNVWHGVLTPLYNPADFLVVDRGGDGENLETYTFDEADRLRVTVSDPTAPRGG